MRIMPPKIHPPIDILITFYPHVSIYQDNLVDSAQFYTSHIGQLAVTNGTLAVDSFFFISGLLVTYIALRNMRSDNGKLNVPLMYLQRYLR